jgi:hypothetical protein
MEGMLRNRIFRMGVVLGAVVLLIWPLTASAQKARYRGRKFKPPPPVSRIVVTVLRNDNDTPIRNAHVIFHPVEGEKDKGGMELKTNDDGVAVMTVIPIGDTVLLQVIAKGYETYGGRYKIEKPDIAMHIKMKLPGQQYSIYDNHENADAGNGSGGSGPGQQQNPSDGASKGSSNGSGSAKPSDSPKQ